MVDYHETNQDKTHMFLYSWVVSTWKITMRPIKIHIWLFALFLSCINMEDRRVTNQDITFSFILELYQHGRLPWDQSRCIFDYSHYSWVVSTWKITMRPIKMHIWFYSWIVSTWKIAMWPIKTTYLVLFLNCINMANYHETNQDAYMVLFLNCINMEDYHETNQDAYLILFLNCINMEERHETNQDNIWGI